VLYARRRLLDCCEYLQMPLESISDDTGFKPVHADSGLPRHVSSVSTSFRPISCGSARVVPKYFGILAAIINASARGCISSVILVVLLYSGACATLNVECVLVALPGIVATFITAISPLHRHVAQRGLLIW